MKAKIKSILKQKHQEISSKMTDCMEYASQKPKLSWDENSLCKKHKSRGQKRQIIEPKTNYEFSEVFLLGFCGKYFENRIKMKK